MITVSDHLRTIRIPLTIFFLLVAVFIGFTIWSHFQLPDKIAVHFDGSGQPNRWSGKWEMTGTMLAVAILYSALFGLFTIYLPKLPAKWWNLPHKNYWLTPEREAQTLKSFSLDYLLMGNIMIALMGYVSWDVWQANTVRPDNSLSMSLWVVLGAVGLVIAITIKMAIQFYRVPKSES